jgi:hypothetical protein
VRRGSLVAPTEALELRVTLNRRTVARARLDSHEVPVFFRVF